MESYSSILLFWPNTLNFIQNRSVQGLFFCMLSVLFVTNKQTNK